ncbi:MAG: GspE/PulE family protein [Gammaproteobacteria bacterium]|nr:GspE/PulE family protein [Gammaproteobacteria bacterium]
MSLRKKVRIGDLLVEHDVITNEQLEIALKEQKKSGRKLGHTLVDLGYVAEDEMLRLLARQLNIELVDLAHYSFDAETVRRLPETLARRFRAIVLGTRRESLLVGMADPTDIFAYDEIAKHLRQSVRLAVVRESELVRTFDLVYRRTEEISNLAEKLGQELSDSDIDLERLVQQEDTVDAPVVKLLHSLFEDATQVGSSDIHIEPDESVLRLRQRIDGVLHEQVMNETRIAPALVLRLKLMAGLDISEKRLPQDGRFNIRVKNRSLDVRLSTMPVQFGESVVMRLLDQSNGILDLAQLGMPDDVLRRFRRNIQRPHGIVLVTGPTGSGKTTTLYAALKEVNTPGRKIITAEDPVEYRLPRVNQVQVINKIGLTFPIVLRTALRQDPDVILIGEMRDQETVEIGLRAAMTGHLVLSTLHTNDAVSTADRLLDMGAEGFLIASSLRAIVAQRLLRRVCKSCAQAHSLSEHERDWLQISGIDQTTSFFTGLGCPHCNNTGYRGRIGVYEILEPDAAMLSALRRGDSAAFAHAAEIDANYRTLTQYALDVAAEGVTSLQEVMRIASEIDEQPHTRSAHREAGKVHDQAPQTASVS